MKKLTLMAILLSFALVACGEKKVEEVKDVANQAVEQVKETATEAKETTMEVAADAKEKISEAATEVKESAEKAVEDVKNKANEIMAEKKDVNFKAEDGTEYTLTLIGDDDAVLKTSTGEEYPLKAAVSGSGVRYADDKGNEIHYKADNGLIKLNGKEVIINKNM